MRALRALDALVARAERVVAVALLVATVTLVVLQVFFRFVLNDSLTWSEEAARYLFVWAALLGFSSSVQSGKLFSFDLVHEMLPPAGRRACQALFVVAAAAFVWVLVTDGVRLVQSTRAQSSPAMELSMAIPYAALPVGGLLIALHLLAGFGGPTGHRPGDERHGAP